ncbi:peptidyl-prolyl cis-trans isomerase PASTICCINO1-like isoform X3 [Quercus lobata]|uniref:peptidyl-prolyl cis-trans isomerase PASTICCINO1-like isoform X3 n=1 Tax=Quercus lobata TaxID=97700 RepID=UPI00124403E0|nr:peptidyl-prolyl cis-trans isomerase PASTICCINO1-like isoform X3 [Quercus lobata]
MIVSKISAETGDGKLILLYMEGEPYFFTFGKSEVPKSLEMGIGMMARGEKAVVYVTSQYLTQSPLIPVIEGLEEVHLEMQLFHFIQGNRLFKEGKFELAKAKYEKNLLHLDVAACQLKLGECRNSIDTCNKVCFMTSTCE